MTKTNKQTIKKLSTHFLQWGDPGLSSILQEKPHSQDNLTKRGGLHNVSSSFYPSFYFFLIEEEHRV